MKQDIERLRDLYLSTMARILINTIYEDRETRGRAYDPQRRINGLDWPAQAFSMIGAKRMENLRQLARRAITENIPGDFIETGVWRGGACIMLRAILQAYGDTERRVFVADSFEGLPPPDLENFPKEKRKDLSKVAYPELAVSQEEVEDAFRKFDLLDDQVRFLKGWFKDTLPTVADRKFAIIRLDGDLYESTIQAFENLYPALSSGGFVIIDDYSLSMCRAAVDDYRNDHGIADEIHTIDDSSVWWQKSG
jgi:O-methyltransferase